MNMATSYYHEPEIEYATDERRGGKEKVPAKKRMQYAKSSRPAVHNGIHRRRNKRFSW
jgi:hypothetical protein